MSLFDKSDLYFYDYNLAGLFVQENYLSVTPKVLNLSQDFSLKSRSAWFGLVWFGLIWFDLIWFDLIWFDLIWFDLKASGGNKRKTMELISKTASSLAEGDIVERGKKSA